MSDPYPVPQQHHDHLSSTLGGEGYRLEGSSSLPFHLPAFVEQFIYQFFQPLSIPLVLFLRGKNAVHNLKLISISTHNVLSWLLSLFSILFPLATMTIVVLWVILRTHHTTVWEATESAAFLRSVDFEVAVIFFNTIFHRGVIALKYAFLPSVDYENIMTNIEDDNMLSDDQLLSGWTNLRSRVIMKEVRLSALRLGIAAESVRIDMNRGQYNELVHSIAPCALDHLTNTGEIRVDSSSNTGTGLSSVTASPAPMIATTVKPNGPFTSVLHPPHRIVPEETLNPVENNTDSMMDEGRIRNTTTTVRNDDDDIASPITPSPVHVHQHNHLNHPPVLPVSSYSMNKPDLSFLHSPSLLEKRTMSVSVLALCAATLSHANNRTITNLRYLLSLSFLVALLIALLPLSVRSWVGLSEIGSASLTRYIVVSCIIMNTWFLSLLLFYLQTGVLDYRRRRIAIQHLGTLATRRFRSPYDDDDNTMEASIGSVKATVKNEPNYTIAVTPSSVPSRSSTSPASNDTTVQQEYEQTYRRSRRVSISIRHAYSFDNASSVSSSPNDDSRSFPASLPTSPSSTIAAPTLLPPVVSLDSVSNIRAWLTAREILRGVGLRYFRRITIIASVSLLFALVTTIISMVRLVLGPDTKSNVFDIREGGVADLIMAIDVIALLTAVGIYLFVMLMDGAKANIITVRQCSLLLGRQAEALTAQSLYETKASQLRLALLRTPNDDPSRHQITNDIEQYSFAAQQWHHTATMLGVAKNSLEHDEPITLLGITCSLTFAQTVAYAVITSQGVVMKLINDKYSFIALPSWFRG